MQHGLLLKDLVREIPGAVRLEGAAVETVRALGVHQDSRAVEPGDLFVARKGGATDGNAFIAQALARGAVALLVEEGAQVPEGVPVVRVADVPSALAYAAAAVYGHPGFSLDVIGITGTNGKTTTSHLVRHALDHLAGRPACATIGTVGHTFGTSVLPAAHTTPEADEIARLLATWRARGAEAVAMEVSSHALTLGRVLAVRFRVAAFTNLTHDHLDFHGSLEEYAAAKTRLFVDHAPGAAVVNVADPVGAQIAKQVRARTLRVSAMEHVSADLVARHVKISMTGTRFVVESAFGTAPVSTRLVGQHNVENLLVTLGILLALDVPFEPAVAAIAVAPSAPGRLERCDEDGDDVVVLVDYAHTPDALARVLEAAGSSVQDAPEPRPRVICVFGCGGDRDVEKRGPMGHAVALGADIAILTSDNPRTEDPAAIAQPSEAALRAGGLEPLRVEEVGVADRGYWVELDRAKAIHVAVTAARPGDVVLLAGKGHEEYQQIGMQKFPFDDRAHAKNALMMRRAERSTAQQQI
jgi:UDP-N-acetylmuramoyl-L-alanyl-D-glutamate--2,6-diaminopimelate ligase